MAKDYYEQLSNYFMDNIDDDLFLKYLGLYVYLKYLSVLVYIPLFELLFFKYYCLVS